MKAVTYKGHGSPDVLRFAEVAKPAPVPNEVVARVHAASVNPIEWHFMRGSPGLVRLMTGLFRPKAGRFGADLAGVVESVGSSVTRFRPGEEVLGAARGTLAQYVAAPVDRLVRKPGNITFEHAAAVPVAGLTALQALRDKGGLQPGQRLLLIGRKFSEKLLDGMGSPTPRREKVEAATITVVGSRWGS